MDVTSQFTYDSAEGDGTGMVLTSSGEILTNNHAVEGSTGISVTIVSVGDAVTGVGNAGGAGGAPSAVTGTVTTLDQTITTQAEGPAASETLHGLIESNANIQAGDSGGPLYNASGTIVGIDTAAQAGGSSVAG